LPLHVGAAGAAGVAGVAAAGTLHCVPSHAVPAGHTHCVPSHDAPPLHVGVGVEQAAGHTRGMTAQSPALTAALHASTWPMVNALASAGE
jgi:hypothetical protein